MAVVLKFGDLPVTHPLFSSSILASRKSYKLSYASKFLGDDTCIMPLTTLKNNFDQEKSRSSEAYHITLKTMSMVRQFPVFMAWMHNLADLGDTSIVRVQLPPTRLTEEDKAKKEAKLNSAPVSKIFTQVCKQKNAFNDAFIIKEIEAFVTDEKNVTFKISDLEDNISADNSSEGSEDESGFHERVMDTIFEKCRHFGLSNSQSLFLPSEDTWNLATLPNDLNRMDPNHLMFWKVDPNIPIIKVPFKEPGFNIPTIKIAQEKTVIPLQMAEECLGLISYMHKGGSRLLYGIEAKYYDSVCSALLNEFPDQFIFCIKGFLRHKNVFIKPAFLERFNIPYAKIVQHQGEYAIVQAGCMYFGFDLGFNVTETVLFHTAETLIPFKTNDCICFCEEHKLHLQKEMAVKTYQPERYRQFMLDEDVEITPFSTTPYTISVRSDETFAQIYQSQNQSRKGVAKLN